MSQRTVVVIGNFDGVHRGHVELIRTARASESNCRDLSAPAANAFTQTLQIRVRSCEAIASLVHDGLFRIGRERRVGLLAAQQFERRGKLDVVLRIRWHIGGGA